MSIFVLGLNHRSAPLSLLERTAVSDSHLPKVLAGISDCENVTGAVILSTCHRLEIYASSTAFHGSYETLKTYLSDYSFVSEDELNSHLYSFTDLEAAGHLFCVVSGLDSAVLGEHEIQGQVKRAWGTAQKEEATDQDINHLFRSALEAGKRVRRETQLLRGALSVSDAAISLTSEILGTLNDTKAVVLGAGEMGQRICTLLSRGAAQDISVASRTYKSASRLAESQNCRAVHLDELGHELKRADVFFSSTGAPNFLLDRDEMEGFMKDRKNKPLLVIDIAVPRDVDPLSAEIEGLTLKDIDDIRRHILATQGHLDEDENVDSAQEILVEEVNRYESQMQAFSLSPIITEFRRHICEISQDEFDRYRSKLDSLEPSEREFVEELVHSIINKVLHSPTVAIQKVDKQAAEDLTKALKDLFKF